MYMNMVAEMKKYLEELRVLDAAISKSQLTEIEVYNISF